MMSSEGGAPPRVCRNCMHIRSIQCKNDLVRHRCYLSGATVSSLLSACDRWQISLEWGGYVKEKT